MVNKASYIKTSTLNWALCLRSSLASLQMALLALHREDPTDPMWDGTEDEELATSYSWWIRCAFAKWRDLTENADIRRRCFSQATRCVQQWSWNRLIACLCNIGFSTPCPPCHSDVVCSVGLGFPLRHDDDGVDPAFQKPCVCVNVCWARHCNNMNHKR